MGYDEAVQDADGFFHPPKVTDPPQASQWRENVTYYKTEPEVTNLEYLGVLGKDFLLQTHDLIDGPSDMGFQNPELLPQTYYRWQQYLSHCNWLANGLGPAQVDGFLPNGRGAVNWVQTKKGITVNQISGNKFYVDSDQIDYLFTYLEFIPKNPLEGIDEPIWNSTYTSCSPGMQIIHGNGIYRVIRANFAEGSITVHKTISTSADTIWLQWFAIPEYWNYPVPYKTKCWFKRYEKEFVPDSANTLLESCRVVPPAYEDKTLFVMTSNGSLVSSPSIKLKKVANGYEAWLNCQGYLGTTVKCYYWKEVAEVEAGCRRFDIGCGKLQIDYSNSVNTTLGDLGYAYTGTNQHTDACFCAAYLAEPEISEAGIIFDPDCCAQHGHCPGYVRNEPWTPQALKLDMIMSDRNEYMIQVRAGHPKVEIGRCSVPSIGYLAGDPAPTRDGFFIERISWTAGNNRNGTGGSFGHLRLMTDDERGVDYAAGCHKRTFGTYSKDYADPNFYNLTLAGINIEHEDPLGGNSPEDPFIGDDTSSWWKDIQSSPLRKHSSILVTEELNKSYGPTEAHVQRVGKKRFVYNDYVSGTKGYLNGTVVTSKNEDDENETHIYISPQQTFRHDGISALASVVVSASLDGSMLRLAFQPEIVSYYIGSSNGELSERIAVCCGGTVQDCHVSITNEGAASRTEYGDTASKLARGCTVRLSGANVPDEWRNIKMHCTYADAFMGGEYTGSLSEVRTYAEIKKQLPALLLNLDNEV